MSQNDASEVFGEAKNNKFADRYLPQCLSSSPHYHLIPILMASSVSEGKLSEQGVQLKLENQWEEESGEDDKNGTGSWRLIYTRVQTDSAISSQGGLLLSELYSLDEIHAL